MRKVVDPFSQLDLYLSRCLCACGLGRLGGTMRQVEHLKGFGLTYKIWQLLPYRGQLTGGAAETALPAAVPPVRGLCAWSIRDFCLRNSIMVHVVMSRSDIALGYE